MKVANGIRKRLKSYLPICYVSFSGKVKHPKTYQDDFLQQKYVETNP
jgi:hypothetical protein